MLQDIVSVGDKIELYRYSNKEKEPKYSRRYLSQLLDFKGLIEACIAMPIENGKIIPFSIGEKYRICYYTKLGLYQCLCEVIDRYKIDNIYIAVVEMKSELEKFQRRQYYRLTYLKEIRYRIDNSNEHEETSMITMQDQTFETATMIDISGGGCKFNSNELIPKDTTLILSFYLELSKGITQFELLGKVVYSSEIQNRKKMYEHRIEFMDINESERENIVRFIFDEERRRRRKEKGLD